VSLYVNLTTGIQSRTLPSWLAETQTANPSLEQCARFGWRLAVEPGPPASGYERLTSLAWVQDPVEPLQAVAVYKDTLIQDRLDEEAAAAAAAQAAAEAHVKAEADAADAIAKAEHMDTADPATAVAELRDIVAALSRLIHDHLRGAV
jgi:hypothetical protein